MGFEPKQITLIDAIQRRRLSALAKASIGVMHECAGSVQDYQVVYASRHGELARTTGLLNQLAEGEDVSPIGFSLAVLNGTAGVFSIATGNRAPSSAISAGPQTFEMGLLEASVQAKLSSRPVLFVYADAPVPEIYGNQTHDASPLHAIALLLCGSPEGAMASLKCTSTSAHQPISNEPSSAIAFANAWSSKTDGQWADGAHVFTWSYQ